jgi:hypothetical protein
VGGLAPVLVDIRIVARPLVVLGLFPVACIRIVGLVGWMVEVLVVVEVGGLALGLWSVVGIRIVVLVGPLVGWSVLVSVVDIHRIVVLEPGVVLELGLRLGVQSGFRSGARLGVQSGYRVGFVVGIRNIRWLVSIRCIGTNRLAFVGYRSRWCFGTSVLGWLVRLGGLEPRFVVATVVVGVPGEVVVVELV